LGGAGGGGNGGGGPNTRVGIAFPGLPNTGGGGGGWGPSQSAIPSGTWGRAGGSGVLIASYVYP
jgi:hypothetical protein